MNPISFFRPEFFWALLVLGVIVLIHLLKRPKTVNLKFSTLRFFQSGAVRSFKARRLRSILQLLVRCAIAALIIALFARPFGKKNPLSVFSDPQASIYFWVDPTLSMDYRTPQGGIGQTAYELVDSLQKKLPLSSKLFLYDHGRKEFMKKDNSGIQFASRHGDPDPGSAVRQLKDEGRERRVLVLLSDFQGNTGQVIDSVLRDLPDEVAMVCVPLSQKDRWNYSISGPEVSYGRESVTVMAHARGKALKAGKIYVTTGKMRTARVEVSVEKDDSAEVKIPLSDMSRFPGGEVILETPDPLSFDNNVYFSAGQQISSKVLVIGSPDENRVIAAAFNVLGPAWENPAVKSELDLIYDDLDSADLIIINSLKRPSRVLEAFAVSQGSSAKAVILSFAAQEEIQSWSGSLLKSAFSSSAGKINGLTLQSPLSPVLPDTLSELWRGFPRVKSEDVLVYAFCKGIPGDVILRLSGGEPLVTKLSDKAGRKWIITATPLGISEENNLCETGFFIPFLDRLARSAVAELKTGKVAWTAGLAFRNPFYGDGAAASVFDSEGRMLTALQNKPSIVLQKAGIYKMVPSGKPSWYFSVNADLRESEIRSTLPSVSGPAGRKILTLKKDGLLSAAEAGSGGAFWYFPWIVLILLLLVETILWTSRQHQSGIAEQAPSKI
ncbi:MAG: hypothetical protein GX556_03130 [Fibrobacter sp.]|nr:hypothetical protein [Fibrobacter sp.]